MEVQQIHAFFFRKRDEVFAIMLNCLFTEHLTSTGAGETFDKREHFLLDSQYLRYNVLQIPQGVFRLKIESRGTRCEIPGEKTLEDQKRTSDSRVL